MNATLSTSLKESKDERIQSARSTTDTRILNLLGQGTPASVVAAATGVTEGYISQLLSQEDFKTEVMEAKFLSLSSHNERDASYDTLEDKLRKQFEKNLPLLQRPMEILKALQVVNKLDRRGSGTADPVTNQSAVVELLIPDRVVQQFTLNVNNQVINVGTESGTQVLETMQSHTLLATAQKHSPQIPQLPNSEGAGGGENGVIHDQRFSSGISDLQEIANRIKQGKSLANITCDVQEVQHSESSGSPREKNLSEQRTYSDEENH